MAFTPKTWVNRSVQYAGRYLQTAVAGMENVFDLSRAEGTIFAEGDKPDATALNDLETRIDSAFANIQDELGWIDVTSQCTWSPLLHTDFIHYAKVNPKIRILDITFLLKAGRESGASIITLPAQYSPNIDKNMTIGQVVYYHIGNVGISYVIDGSHVIKGFHTTNAATQDYEYFHFMLPY